MARLQDFLSCPRLPGPQSSFHQPEQCGLGLLLSQCSEPFVNEHPFSLNGEGMFFGDRCTWRAGTCLRSGSQSPRALERGPGERRCITLCAFCLSRAQTASGTKQALRSP